MKKIILYILFLLPVLAYNQSGGAYHFPKKTTAQRDALTGMIAGEMILNTTTNTIEYYTGSAWAAFGGGAANIDTVAKVSRIANYTGTAKAIVVTDSLEGGLFVLSPKTVSVNNALYYKDGNTRQFARVYDGPLNLWWFGAKPDNTGDLTVAINAAIAASTSTQSSPLGAVDNLYLPSGTYRVASDLILEKAVSIKGVIGENNSNVIVNMNGNKIVIEHNTTSASGTTADATELANIKFVGDGTDTCIVAHANFTYRNIRATNFDVGIATIADLSQGTGNANHWEAHDVQISDCTIGWLVEGDDANHGAAYKLNVIRCDTAIYDRSFLGNSYYTPHTASSGYAFYTTGAQNRSHFHDIYAEGSEGVGKEQWVSINHPSRGNVTTIGNGSQLIGTGFIELGYSQGIGLHHSKNQYYNDVFNLELGGQTGGTRAFEFRGLTDTDPGMTWQYQNGSYVLGHRGFDARRGMAIAGDATTLTNQHGTTRTGGSIVFPWGIWTGGGAFTGNNAARILGNTDTTGIVSPVNGDFMFNSQPTGLGGVPFYYRKNSAWKNPWTLTGTFDDANNEIDFTGESTPAFSVDLQAVMDSINASTGNDNLGNHTATQNIRLNGNWLSGDGGNEGMQVNYLGYVGIGTGSPLVNLHVLGLTTIPQTIFDSGARHLQIFSGSHNVNYDYSQEGAIIFNSQPYVNRGVNTGRTERLRITGSGELGIATISPTEKLHVTGNIRFSGALMPNNLAGTAGQVLKSAGSGVAPTWGSITTIQDADADTKIQVEESPDEDVIRFDAGGNGDIAVFYNNRIDFNRRAVVYGSTGINTNTAPQISILNNGNGQFAHLFLNTTTNDLEIITAGTTPSLTISSDGTTVTVADDLTVGNFFNRASQTVTTTTPAITNSFVYLNVAGGSLTPGFTGVQNDDEITFKNINATTTTINAPTGYTWEASAPSLAQYESINVKVDGTVLRQF